jgi:hypothetical protein
MRSKQLSKVTPDSAPLQSSNGCVPVLMRDPD